MNKKKLLVITEHDLSNYGNRFQNIALSKYLEKNFSVDVYSLRPVFNPTMFHRVGYPIRRIQYGLHTLFSKCGALFLKKMRMFVKFNKNETKTCGLVANPFAPLKSLNKKFDYFLVGSDQVFSSEFGVADSLSSLSFAEPKKRISYAASTGVGKFDPNRFPLVASSLKDFKAVSVREEEDAVALAPYCKEIPACLCDPVFLLTKEEWLAMSTPHLSKKAKEMMKEPYAFVYWLGPDIEGTKEKIESDAKKKGLKVIYARTASTGAQGGYIDMSPYDFINLISNASCVYSKSFHGTAMAIVFHKDFVSYDAIHEKDKCKHDPRLLNLCTKFGLPVDRLDFFADDHSPIDWVKAEEGIKKERGKARLFLDGALRK